MRYEIDYLSKSGNTKKLADAIENLLPVRDTEIIDLLQDGATTDADIYLLVFSFNKGAVPLAVMEALERLEGKTLLLFVTFGAGDSVDYQMVLQQKIEPFLPTVCDYRGMFLCKGAFPDTVIAAAEEKLKQDPENEYAEMVHACCEQAMRHPNQTDLENAQTFVRNKLGL